MRLLRLPSDQLLRQGQDAGSAGGRHHGVDVDAQGAGGKLDGDAVVRRARKLAARRRARSCRCRGSAPPRRRGRGGGDRVSPSGSRKPGASGTSSTMAASSGGAKRTWRPSSPRRIGSSWAATAERPTADGLASATTSSRDLLRLPHGPGADEVAGHRGHVHQREVGSPAAAHGQRGLALDAALGWDRPARSRPAPPPGRPRWPRAAPGTRCSSRSRGRSGTSPHSRATSRWVPSPPSTAIAATPASHISGAARTVSRSVPVGVQSSVSSSGRARAGQDMAAVAIAADHAGRDAVRRRHHQHPLHSGGPEAGHQPEDHRRLLGVVEDGPSRHQSPDVATRCRVGDEPDGQRRHGGLRSTTGALLIEDATATTLGNSQPRCPQLARGSEPGT